MKQRSGHQLLLFFALCWLVINCLQAALTGLDGDEAYYWTFSQNLSWGYFDHPPMVALSIKLGEWFGHGSFFTRLGTVLLSTGTVLLLYHCIPPVLRDTKRLLFIFASVVLFHVYGFIVTPDAGLLFFTAFFFFAYRRLLEKESLKSALLIGVSIAGLMYSKYHGVLPVFFTVLSNPRLLLRPFMLLGFAIAAVLLVPHLYWQWQHDFPTFRYHLSERIGSRYRIDKTTNYLAGQAAIWGPFTMLPFLFRIFKTRLGSDLYLRAHRFTFWGVLLFFLLNSFRSTIEPHWTLTAGVSFVVLFNALWAASDAKWQRLFFRLTLVNIILLMAFRVLFTLPSSPLQNMQAFRYQFTGKAMADSLYKRASGRPIVFPDAYTLPSLYRYYHPGEQAIGYPTVRSRKNHFNISEDAQALHNQPVWVALGGKIDSADIQVTNPYQTFYLHSMPQFRNLAAVQFNWKNAVDKMKAGSEIEVILNGSNLVNISGDSLKLNYIFLKTRKEFVEGKGQLITGRNSLIEHNLRVKAPEQKGKYSLIFTLEQAPFAGSFNSKFYTVEVN